MARLARPASAPVAAAERFFSNAFLMQLERLAFVSKRSHIGAVKGERKSPRRGSSVDPRRAKASRTKDRRDQRSTTRKRKERPRFRAAARRRLGADGLWTCRRRGDQRRGV